MVSSRSSHSYGFPGAQCRVSGPAQILLRIACFAYMGSQLDLTHFVSVELLTECGSINMGTL